MLLSKRVVNVEIGDTLHPVVPLFTFGMFLSALLLFWVQPLFAKMVLPKLGGSPSVWNTAMVFFQAVLLAGYAYAHLVARLKSPRRELLFHLAILVAAGSTLPFAVASYWQPEGHIVPAIWLLVLLATSVGLPFFALSATAPLLQHWFAFTDHPQASDPYFLYAASNLGSFLALLAFPFVFEPTLTVTQQCQIWAASFCVLGLLILLAGVAARTKLTSVSTKVADASEVGLDWRVRSKWIIYSAIPSSLMLGVSNHITTDIAAAPLLWVVPLSLYLLTFVIAFARRSLLSQAWVVRAFPFVILVLVPVFSLPAARVLPLHLLVFFLAALMCVGELAKSRPATVHLTEFYLFLSLGGVLGGALTALAAPAVFDRVYEYPIALVAAAALLPTRERKPQQSDVVFILVLSALLFGGMEILRHFDGVSTVLMQLGIPAIAAVATLSRVQRSIPFAAALAVIFVVQTVVPLSMSTEWTGRSFFGVYRVAQSKDKGFQLLMHGTTLHGAQNLHNEGGRPVPATYYAPDSPVAEVIKQAQSHGSIKNVSVVGLGIGSLVCYQQPGETWQFFEIDPLVRWIAFESGYFSLGHECGGPPPVTLGDARLTLAKLPDSSQDIVVIDAFSSDSIPLHLLTREAISLYLTKLQPDGLLLLHVSNRHLDLKPVVARIARDTDLVMFAGDKRGTAKDYSSVASIWIALARAPAVIDRLELGSRWRPVGAPDTKRAWTDDYANILEAFN